MIIFKSVTSKNFYAIGNQPLTVNLDRGDSTLIIGGNGSGKTSATIEALVYCLYGKPYRKINLSGIVNSANKNNCLVEVEFEKAGVSYRVVRGEKPKKFEVYKDDVLIEPPASSKDYQVILEDILGMDYKVFSQVVVLNKSRFVPFMDLSTADRRYIVEEFLDINIIGSMLEITRKKIKDIQNEIRNKETDSVLLQTNIDKMDSLIVLAETKNEKNKENIQERIDGLKRDLEGYARDIRGLVEENRKLYELVESLREKLDEEEVANAEEEKRNLELENYTLKSDLKRIKKDAEFFLDSSTCPTCTQDISEEFKNACISDIKQKGIETRKKSIEADKRIKELSGVLDKFSVLDDEISSYVSDMSTLRSKISNKETLSKQTQKQIDSMEDELSLEDDDNEIEENRNSHKDLVKQKKALDKVRNNLYDVLENMKIVEGLFKEDGIKSNIVKQYLPVINKKVNEYLGLMNLPSNFYLDEEFNESINIPGKEKFVYYNFSDGQKTRIDLAMLMTWIHIAKEKNSINTNLLILDEILEALDINGIHDFLNTIKYVFDVNLFVISQRGEELSDCFKNQMKFELKNNFTKLTEQG